MKFKEVDLAIQKMNRLCEEMRIEEKEINEIEEMKVNDLLYDFDTFSSHLHLHIYMSDIFRCEWLAEIVGGHPVDRSDGGDL